jgi:hypothetical protein
MVVCGWRHCGRHRSAIWLPGWRARSGCSPSGTAAPRRGTSGHSPTVPRQEISLACSPHRDSIVNPPAVTDRSRRGRAGAMRGAGVVAGPIELRDKAAARSRTTSSKQTNERSSHGRPDRLDSDRRKRTWSPALHVNNHRVRQPRAVATSLHPPVHRVATITSRSGLGSPTTDPLDARSDAAKKSSGIVAELKPYGQSKIRHCGIETSKQKQTPLLMRGCTAERSTPARTNHRLLTRFC